MCMQSDPDFFLQQRKLSFPEHSFFLLDILSDDSCFYLLVVDEFLQFIKLGAMLPSQEWEVTRTLWRWKRAMMSSSLFTGLASSRPWSVQGGLTRHTEMCTGYLSRAVVFLMFPKTDFSLSKKKYRNCIGRGTLLQYDCGDLRKLPGVNSCFLPCGSWALNSDP